MAAAQVSDALVLVVIALGAVLGLTGIASLGPRVRNRLPIVVLARRNVAATIGLIVAGFALVSIALGLFEG